MICGVWTDLIYRSIEGVFTRYKGDLRGHSPPSSILDIFPNNRYDPALMFKKPFKSNDRFGSKPGGRKFGAGAGGGWNKGPRTGGFDRPMMHKATCATCGNDCQVPFRPNGSKPVYCSNCFDRSGDGSNTGGGFVKKSWGERSERSFSSEKPLFKTKCDKCQNPCEVPFRPNGSKPVYCKDCFGGNRGGDERPERFERTERPRAPDISGEQLRVINAKLDEILKKLGNSEV